jgi:hypothetical protein
VKFLFARVFILFNEIFQESGNTKKDHPILEQEDAMAERDVSLHRTERNIRDDKEMVVGLAFKYDSFVFSTLSCTLIPMLIQTMRTDHW